MIQLTDNQGKMLPAIRNTFTLLFFIAFFIMGWFAHMNWALRAEADQLVDDAKVSANIREDETVRIDVLEENIENAITIEQNDCSCGDATDIEFMHELRKKRETGFQFNGTDSF